MSNGPEVVPEVASATVIVSGVEHRGSYGGRGNGRLSL